MTRRARTTATRSSQADPDGGYFFPDYPKYGVWTDSYVLTTRDFGSVDGYGISVYALEKNKMVNGQPNARSVQFFLDSDVVPINLIGDGLLPADADGKQKPKTERRFRSSERRTTAVPTAPFDALSVWDTASSGTRRRGVARPGGAGADGRLRLNLPVRADDRDCLPTGDREPGPSTSTSIVPAGRPGGSRTGTSRTTRRS